MEVEKVRSIFPKTVEILQEESLLSITHDFHEEMKALFMINDAFSARWFPVYLKMRGFPQSKLEVAEFEYLQHLVKVGDFGEVKRDTGVIRMNPSLQFVQLSVHQPKLRRPEGLYCFFKKGPSLFEVRISVEQALILDILHQDVRVSKSLLAQMAKDHVLGGKMTQEGWEQLVSDMISLGILYYQD